MPSHNRWRGNGDAKQGRGKDDGGGNQNHPQSGWFALAL